MAFQKSKPTEVPSNQLNMITAGTYLEGTIDTKGSIQIHGKVKGIVKAGDEVRVGSSGEIIGEVYAKTARIGGKVEGNINVEQKLILESTSSLVGNLSTGKLIIDEGAHFNGTAEMADGGKLTQNGKKGLFEKSGQAKDVRNAVSEK